MSQKRAIITLLMSALLLGSGVFVGNGQTFPDVLRINFQTAGAPTPGGYIADTGAGYGARGGGLTYGWVATNGSGTPQDMTAEARDRDRPGVDQLLDTLVHMDLTGSPNGWWEIAVPDGQYDVTVSVGDEPGLGGVYDSTHVIRAEGVIVIGGFIGNGSNVPDSEYAQATRRVTVSDGRLTIDDVGGTNTKINYIIIDSVPASEEGDSPGLGFIPGISIPNIGTVQINASSPVQIYTQPGGTPVSDEDGNPILLPNDSDNSGADTHFVTETATVDGEIWLGLFLGSRTYVWVPLSSVTPLTAIEGLEDADVAPLLRDNVQPQVFDDGFAIVNTSRLNMRSGDGPRYSIVTILNGGTQLNILGRNDDRSWWYVESNGNVGWVSGEFIIIRGDLTAVPEQESAGETVAPSFLVYSNSMIYTMPSNLRSNRLCEIPGGVAYNVIGRSNASNWYLIETNCGRPLIGWIQAEQGAIRNPSSQVIPVR